MYERQKVEQEKNPKTIGEMHSRTADIVRHLGVDHQNPVGTKPHCLRDH